MKAKRVLSAFLAASLGLVGLSHAPDVLAQGKKGKKSAPAAPAGPPMVKKPLALPLPGITWGLSTKQVAVAIDKIVDDDYRPQYKKVQPGVQMKALDAKVAEVKSEFRRSRIDFGNLPTGVDTTPLRGEYTYKNKETLMTLLRHGEKVHFFFIGDRLWKIIREISLGEKSRYGSSFPEGVVKLASIFGVPGRVLPPEGERYVTEVDWKDAATHLRAIERNDTAMALAYEDNATLGNLDALRPNKPAKTNDIDPDVAAAIRGDGPSEAPNDKK